MEFDWDPAKDAANLEKHGFSLLRATAVFDDPLCIIENSTRPEHGEQRQRAIGLVDRAVIAVTFTDREQRRRVISAMRARRDERGRYDRGAAAG